MGAGPGGGTDGDGRAEGGSVNEERGIDAEVSHLNGYRRNLRKLAAGAGVKTPEQVEDSFLVGACWLMVWAIGVVLVVRELVRW